MIDLDREMRALLEEDASQTPPAPDAEPALRRTRRRQLAVALTVVAAVAAVAIGSFAGVSALVRTSERHIPIGPGETLSPAAVAGLTCPPGSTPDQPGPVDQARPQKDEYTYAATTFDRGSGQMLLLSAEGAFWTFDVCANTWEEAPGPEGIRGGLTELVYDVDSDRAIAIERASRVSQVWTYERDGRTWTEKGQWAVGAIPEPMFGEPLQAAYDAVTGLVMVRDQFTSEMWTYDVDADAWAEVDQGPVLPPVVEGTNDPPVELLAYDASADRLVLYVSKPLRTWEFDIQAGRWTEQEVDTPATGFGWFATGEELAYDEANDVSVLFSFGTLATYDASEHRWHVLRGGEGVDVAPAGPATRLYFAMTYDPVNERIVVAGGDVMTPAIEWRTTDDVWAFDVEAGGWTTLLAPTDKPA